MQIDFSIEVKSNRFAAMAQETYRLLDKIVRKTAFDLEARAKALCAVDTGALRASIYTATGSQSTFGKARADALSRNKDAQFGPEEKPDGDLCAIVAVGVLYGVYVEFGTIKMPAHPFFGPAVAAVRPQFEKAVELALAGT